MIMICVKVRISLIRVNPSDFLTSELHLRVHIVSILIWLARFMPLESWLYTMTIGWELYMEWGARKVTLSIENRKNVDISKWRCSEEVTRVLGKSHSEKRHSESCLSHTTLTIAWLKKKLTGQHESCEFYWFDHFRENSEVLPWELMYYVREARRTFLAWRWNYSIYWKHLTNSRPSLYPTIILFNPFLGSKIRFKSLSLE